ncbi:UNVERIFIED_ORG: hemoglobin [Methylobacterium sp. SuP10 SLI 274]|uniref:group III truncated hemoglobin n=1 Tax=Methylorubrum extorquens TaxID=408 RepID=UPI0020A195F8|nr:group III truncated hemoglobin [Methylorubrum extorquens]MDF9863421.1 hemoglobin [Methylorubrum pseudosasae]MDH6637029.1 hemoglobin [Methylobacterium sp. SuP10 SLI 274]MDH6666205.1 hemoglobin [Methylorubrum zatmanii]MCP1558120.1 hemoglobin [Methylorubrum extorquens]MDF9791730.1 hemoglobin [Methylorubrum extorquens]
MKQAELTEAALAAFLDAFYARVRRDPLIGPVFAAKIPDEAWPRHLATIRDFWSSVLLKTGRYKGNPFGRHLGIEGISPAHFTRWLGLFEETAREVFVPEIAGILVERAHRIGDSLKSGLFFRPEMPAVRP